MTDAGQLNKQCLNEGRPQIVDLFSGCGGMSLGFQNAGFNIIAAFDYWKPAVDVYRLNFKHPIHQADLSTAESQAQVKAYAPDIIIGGPPCQDFSSAGHRNESLGRAALSTTYSEIVANIKPNYFVMENVPEITKSEAIKTVLSTLKGAGYGLTQRVLEASYCGVPQSRKRFFLIGCMGAEDDFLQDYLNKHLADKPMTMYDYFGNSLNTEYYFRVPRSYSRRGIFSIYEPCQTVRGVDRPIPTGYIGHPSDPVAVDKARALTVFERSYVQTFPRDFVFEGSKGHLNQMIGNAVPVKLAEFVARALSEYIKDAKRGAKCE
jgi:DNA (cytosine-5)-methyltransferase 1